MHEWALAEAIIDASSQIAEKEGLIEISEVIVKLGELQQIEKDILRFALLHLRTEKFRKTRFRLETEKAQLKCRACGNSWTFNKKKLGENASEAIHFVPEIAHTYVNCPKCCCPDFEILEGRGILIQRVRGVKKS